MKNVMMEILLMVMGAHLHAKYKTILFVMKQEVVDNQFAF
jgi:hypothetical protein